MSTIDDIIAEKNKALSIVDQKILDASDLLNAGNAAMDDVIATLQTQRQAILDQALNNALDSTELAAALAVLRAATNRMNDVAARMVKAADFISQIANFGTEANGIVAALRGNA